MTNVEEIEQSWESLFLRTRDFDISLFIGAGLSTPNGLPNWDHFCQLLLRNDAQKKLIGELHRLGLSYPAIIDVAYKQFSESNSSEEWFEFVRTALYADFRTEVQSEQFNLSVDVFADIESRKVRCEDTVSYFKRVNPSLLEIVKMCSKKEDGVHRIISILTTNLDSLLQICDRALNGSPRSLRTVERVTKSTEVNKVPIYHLHGHLKPQNGAASKDENRESLILRESEYNQRTDLPYHWASTKLHWALQESPCVFIGCSMTDELVRRALFRTRTDRLKDLSSCRNERKRSKLKRARHFSVCKWIDDPIARDCYVKNLLMIDTSPLWVSGFEELPDRIATLSTALSS